MAALDPVTISFPALPLAKYGDQLRPCLEVLAACHLDIFGAAKSGGDTIDGRLESRTNLRVDDGEGIGGHQQGGRLRRRMILRSGQQHVSDAL